MRTISKRDLMASAVSRTGHSGVLASDVCRSFLDQIVEELAAGNRLEFRGFGVFDLKRRQECQGRNPKTGEPVKIPPRTVVAFRPGRRVKALLPDVPTS